MIIAEKLKDGLVEIMDVREELATFLAQHTDTPNQIIKVCDENNWEESVAYELREALCKLGSVLAVLTLWEKALKLPKEAREAAEKARNSRGD